MTATLAQLSQKVGFIGAGNMATALIGGLVRAGLPAAQIWATDVDQARLSEVEQSFGVSTEKQSTTLVEQCDVIFVAVKPGAVESVLNSIKDKADGKLFVSIAAGVTTAQMENILGQTARVVRCMPNTPALVSCGATAICAGSQATAQDMSLTAQLLDAVGTTETVAEALMDAVTGLSGSGPAYVMLIIEALADGGVRSGLPRQTAMALATQTVLGAAQLVKSTGKHPGELKDMVTSPGGTTICGVEVLEERGLRSALLGAVVAATAQSKKLSQK